MRGAEALGALQSRSNRPRHRVLLLKQTTLLGLGTERASRCLIPCPVANAANEPPVVGSPQLFNTSEDTPMSVGAPGLLASSYDVNFDRLTASLVSQPLNAAVTVNGDGSFDLMPAANFNGRTSFVFGATVIVDIGEQRGTGVWGWMFAVLSCAMNHITLTAPTLSATATRAGAAA